MEGKAFVIWYTGLSGAGKSTMAEEANRFLLSRGIRSFVLDGDALREGINSDLGFTLEDRTENLRRAAEIAKILLSNNIVVLCSFITPMEGQRQMVKEIVGMENYVEVYASCPLEVCTARDVKGLYQKAKSVGIENFTGISMVYEVPENSDLTIDSSVLNLTECNEILMQFLHENKWINIPETANGIPE